VRLDGAAVHLDEGTHERQPDAEPALRALERSVHLREHLEDVRQRRRRDADSTIAHAHDRAFAVTLGAEPDPPAFRVLRGVVQ
jgi:hypothetical protein